MSILCECPICSRVCCEHTEEERGGPFDVERPKIPNVAHMLSDQKSQCGSCENYIRRLFEAIPAIFGDQLKLICSVCYHKRVGYNSA